MSNKKTSSAVKFLTILIVSLGILTVMLLILRKDMKTLEIKWSPGGMFDSFDVKFGQEGIAEVSEIYQTEDEIVHVIFRSVKEGTTSFTLTSSNKGRDWDSSAYIDTIIVDRAGLMRTASFTFNGVRVLILAMGLVFLATGLLLLYWFRKGRRTAFFSYRYILDFGLSVFFLIQSLVLIVAVVYDRIHPELQIRGEHFFRLTNFSMTLLVLLSFPVLFIFSLFLSASNISLIRKEGSGFSNMLGILLSGLLMVGIGVSAYLLINSPGTLDYSPQETILVVVRNITAAVFFYFECHLLSTFLFCQMAGRHKPAFDKDYLIILGCGIREDGTLYPLLQGRADRAIAFYRAQLEKTGRKAFFVPSGGQGPDECMPEGEAIRNYLISQGIPEEQIIPETKSVNTLQNMKFSREIIRANAALTEQPDVEDPVIAFSTTNYHVFRAGILAADLGMNVDGMGAKTKWYFWPNALIREFVGMLVREWKLHLSLLIVIATLSVFSANLQWLFELF